MEKLTSIQLVRQLDLQPHPEGGYFKETYRCEEEIHFPSPVSASRNISTAIYYLLENNDFSAFHRIKSDELWHHYMGEALLISVIHTDGSLEQISLGKNISEGEVLQACVPAGAWFASEVKYKQAYALVGCTVAPGFDFQDFEMAKKGELLSIHPQHSQHIERLTR